MTIFGIKLVSVYDYVTVFTCVSLVAVTFVVLQRLLERLPWSQWHQYHRLMVSMTDHVRLKPVKHSFKYPVIFVCLDLDYLDTLPLLMSLDRSNVFSIWTKDYVNTLKQVDHLNVSKNENNTGLMNAYDDEKDPTKHSSYQANSIKNAATKDVSIKEYILMLLQNFKVDVQDLKKIELVTIPRVFGIAFNPLTIYYCYNNNGDLKLTLLQVNNTFGERHWYVCEQPMKETRPGYDRSYCFKKQFHVSPFNDMKGMYHAHIVDPKTDKLDVLLRIMKDNDLFFKARVYGRCYGLNNINVTRTVFQYPLSLIFTFPRILVQAMILYFQKKLPIIEKPEMTGNTVKVKNDTVDTFLNSFWLSSSPNKL